MTDVDDGAKSGSDLPGLDLGLPPAAPASAPYRVLARKYRPSTFDDLIGQEALVRTISNTFDTGRIPQAWILTGVRGIGKTTTARILARGLNYELADGSVRGPTIHMPALGVHCQAIMESRHMDVLEMDAASHTSVDDVRKINDSVSYVPTSARYKVYIIDEVHMLSGSAFNAFLKTLEEPPEHAKFVFATTEIRKVPVTVLSRCQRFDLRRIKLEVLMQHLASIAAKEGVEIEQEALAIIARAAEGSVRDSLSLLDQAIAHAAGTVKAEALRQMLGLADRTRVIDLFAALAAGDIAAGLREFREQYDIGADPAVVLSDLAEFVNFVTRVKIVPEVAENVAHSETERQRARDFAVKISIPALARMWQMLLKGESEVEASSRPAEAAEMVLVRIAYAAGLPPLEEVLRSVQTGTAQISGMTQGSGPAQRAVQGTGQGTGQGVPQGAAQATVRGLSQGMAQAASQASAKAMTQATAHATAQPAALATHPRAQLAASAPQPAAPLRHLASFTELVELAAEKRDLLTRSALEADMRLVAFEDGRLEIALEPTASKQLISELSRKLEQWTGRRWTVVVSNAEGQPTLRSVNLARKEEHARNAEADPRVREVLARFPGARIVEIRKLAPEPPAEPASDYGSDDMGSDAFGDDADDS